MRLILFFTFLTVFIFNPCYSQKSKSDDSSLKVYTITGEVAKKYSVNQKYLVFIPKNLQSDSLNVYFNKTLISNLNNHRHEENFYQFSIPEKIPSGDSLKGIFYEKFKSEVPINLIIAKGLDGKTHFKQEALFIIDKHQKKRNWFVAITTALLFIISIFVIRPNKGEILRDQGIKGELAPFSLARTQMAFWTILVLISFTVIWLNTGEILEIPQDVLVLLGISAGTTLGASLIDNDDIKNPKIIRRHQESSSSGTSGIKVLLTNIVSDHRGISIHRFQNVAFSLAIGGFFMFEVFSKYSLPEINENLMWLMGISSGTYLGIKKGENKAYQNTPVG